MMNWAEVSRVGFAVLCWELAALGLAVLAIGWLDKACGRGFQWATAALVVIAAIAGLLAGSGLQVTWG